MGSVYRCRGLAPDAPARSFATLGGLDALVFTAGIGENSVGVRERVLRGLEVFGLELDPVRNGAADGPVSEITIAASDAVGLVIETDEEGEIARQTMAVATT